MRSYSLPRRVQLRCGAVAPLTVLCLALLVGVTALVIDGGTLMEARRHVQAAADAAALAGADDLYANYLTNQGIDYGSAKSSALTTASANGYTSDNSIVTVNTPGQTYQGGSNSGKTIPPGYIEVLIQYNAPHLFSGVFGSGTSPVCARAVARGRCAPLTSNGLVALSLGAAGALNIGSLGGLTVNGGILVNSNNPQGFKANTLGKVTASQFILNLGSSSQQGGGGGVLGNLSSLLGQAFFLLFGPGNSAPSIISSGTVPDPLRYLSPPPEPVNSYPAQFITGGTVDLKPGVYNGGIQVTGIDTQVTLHANTDGTPGIYYLTGSTGLQVSGRATVKTAPGEAGVIIYNDWSTQTATINVNTFGSFILTPPSTGLYRGISIFQKRGSLTNPAPPVTLNVSRTVNVTGTIYAAHAGVSLTTNSNNNVMGGQIIADTILTSGSATININPGSQPIANLRILGLVE